MENKKTFGNFIRKKRKEAGLTQKEFAEKIYITESAVSKWERGQTYPDITMVKDICEILSITERELLTASEDTQTRFNEKLLDNYLKATKRYKRISAVVYGGTLLICLISNLIAQHTLSWFFIVLASVLVLASLTLLPVYLKKHGGLITLGAFTLSTILLLWVCNIYSGGDWFLVTSLSTLLGICLVFLPYVFTNIGLPERLQRHRELFSMIVDTALLFILLIAAFPQADVRSLIMWLSAFWLVIPFGMLFVIRYTRINNFFKTAACIFISALILFLNDGVTSIILAAETMTISQLLQFDYLNVANFGTKATLVTMLALVVAFVVAGIMSTIRKNEKNNNNG